MLRLGESAQLGQLFFTLRTSAFCQIGQEIQHLLRVFRHFGGERFMGVVFKTQQFRQFMTQREDLFHNRAVIPLASIRPLVRGAGAVGAVHLFTQRLIVAVGHHRQVARNIQRQQIALLFFGFGLRFCGSQRAFRHAGKFRFIGNQLAPAHGGVEHVVAVSRTQFGQSRGDFAIALLFVFRQADAGEFKITQRVIHRFFLGGIEGGVVLTVMQIAVGVIQPFMLTHPGAVFGQQRQRLFIGFAQFRAVLHRIKVADRRENTP